jgi:hypothetical protein
MGWVGISSPATPKIEPGCSSKGTNCNCPCMTLQFLNSYVLFICSNLATNYCHPSDAILRFETPSCELQMLLHESLQDLYSILQLLQTY